MQHIDYLNTLKYLYASQPAFHKVGATAYKPGLDNTIQLMNFLGNPHLGLRTIHVAGTNGKGSTSHLIAASLQAQGYKVGLFTSPHLVDFRERIRINGQEIPQETVVQFVANLRGFLDQLRPSFFETTMAMAFWYFAQQQVDIAVVEVGLGGRLDSTNIIKPLISVITNIGIDHTDFLGNTLSQIAYEKAGIIKPLVPCVVGESHPETQSVFLEKAKECDILGEGLETTNCRIWFADQCGYMRKRRLKDAPICQLQGFYQEKNQQTAFVAIQVLRNFCGITISHEAIAKGFAQVCTMTGLRGRWEVLSQSPLTICDTGHNGHGIQYVASQLRTLVASANRKLIIVLGMVDDKDIDVVLNLLPKEATYYFTQPSTPRAFPAKKMQSIWQELYPEHVKNFCFDSVDLALCAAKENASNDDIIFIGGSNYLVGEVLSNTHNTRTIHAQ